MLDDLNRAFGSAFAAVLTFIVIDVRNVVYNMNGIIFALFLTNMAGDAADGADLFDVLPGIPVRTAYSKLVFIRKQLDDVLRAGDDTFAAGLAGFAVDTGNTVHNVDGVKGTCPDAGAKPQTSVCAVFVGKSAVHSRLAVLNADIVHTGNRVPAGSVASNIGNLLYR